VHNRIIILSLAVFILATASICMAQQSRPSIAYKMLTIIREQGIDTALSKYAELRHDSIYQYNFDLDQLQTVANALIEGRHTAPAIRILELNARIFPDSAQVYHDLGRAFYYTGERTRSRKYFSEALARDSLLLSAIVHMKNLTFVPDDFVIPTHLTTQHFRIRPLRQDDLKLHYQAIVKSHDHLQGIFGPHVNWPPGDLTIEDHRYTLKVHETQFRHREGFSFIVLNHSETECLGSFHIFPSRLDEFNAEVIIWSSADASDRGLDSTLFRTVDNWLHVSWPFDQIVYPSRSISWDEYLTRMDSQDSKYH